MNMPQVELRNKDPERVPVPEILLPRTWMNLHSSRRSQVKGFPQISGPRICEESATCSPRSQTCAQRDSVEEREGLMDLGTAYHLSWRPLRQIGIQFCLGLGSEIQFHHIPSSSAPSSVRLPASPENQRCSQLPSWRAVTRSRGS